MRRALVALAAVVALTGCGDKRGSIPWLGEGVWRSATPAQKVEICNELSTAAGRRAFYLRQVHAFEDAETPTRSARELTEWVRREKC